MGDNTDFRLDQASLNGQILTELRGIHDVLGEIKVSLKDDKNEITEIKVDLASRPCEKDWGEMTKRVTNLEKKVYAATVLVAALQVGLGFYLK